MDTSKLINGSRAEVLDKRSVPAAKTDQTRAVRSEAKGVDKRSGRKKTKTERPQVKAVRSSKSEKLVCRYCGSEDLAPSFIKRRDRRCRKCFSKRYGSAAHTKKTKVKK
jgi:ribosomal protein L37AE/L43A